jgi:hypothetical protein
VLTDAISEWMLTSEPSRANNLRHDEIPAERVAAGPR